MKFTRKDSDKSVKIEISNESTIDEALEAFRDFLRACGYTINYDEVIIISNFLHT